MSLARSGRRKPCLSPPPGPTPGCYPLASAHADPAATSSTCWTGGTRPTRPTSTTRWGWCTATRRRRSARCCSLWTPPSRWPGRRRPGGRTCWWCTTRCSCAGCTGSPRRRRRGARWRRWSGPGARCSPRTPTPTGPTPGVSDAMAAALGLTDVRPLRAEGDAAGQAHRVRPGGRRRAGPRRAVRGRGRADRGLRVRLVHGAGRGQVPPARGRQPGHRARRRPRGRR